MKLARTASERAVPRGIYASIVTPRRPGEVEVDLGAMLEVIDFVSSRGADGIALFGSTGEFVHFTPEERSRFVALATKRSRVPVLANVSHSTLDGATAMAEEAAGTGAAGVLLQPPHYFTYDADAITSFFLEFAALVAKWIPIYIDNSPQFTSAIPPQAAEALLRSGQFAGLKDSSGDASYIERLAEAGLPVTLLCGDDALLLRSRRAGAPGAVSAVAAAAPELIAALNRAIETQDDAASSMLDSRVHEFLAWLRRFPQPVAIREAAAIRGVKVGRKATPLGPSGEALLDEFREWFRAWIKVVEAECKLNK